MINMFKFWLGQYKDWKAVGITFWVAYDWHKRHFILSEAQHWRSYSLFEGMACIQPAFAEKARLFCLTPEEAIERFKRFLGGQLAKPIKIYLDYCGKVRTTATAQVPIGIAVTEGQPIYDADLDTEEVDNGKV